MWYDRKTGQIEAVASEITSLQTLSRLGSNLGAVDPERHGSLSLGPEGTAVADKIFTKRVIGGLVVHAYGEVSAEHVVVSEKEARHFLLDNELGRVYGYGKHGSEEEFIYYREKFLANENEQAVLLARANAYAGALTGKPSER